MTSSSLGPLAAFAALTITTGAVRAEPPPRPAAEDHKSMLAAEAVALAGVYAGLRISALDAGYPRLQAGATLGMLTAAPSFGHLYAGQRRRALIGIGLRVASLGIAAVGLDLYRRCRTGRSPCDEDHDLEILGSMGFLGVTVWQLIDAPFAARRANRRARARALTVVPLTSANGAPAGLSLTGVF